MRAALHARSEPECRRPPVRARPRRVVPPRLAAELRRVYNNTIIVCTMITRSRFIQYNNYRRYRGRPARLRPAKRYFRVYRLDGLHVR